MLSPGARTPPLLLSPVGGRPRRQRPPAQSQTVIPPLYSVPKQAIHPFVYKSMRQLAGFPRLRPPRAGMVRVEVAWRLQMYLRLFAQRTSFRSEAKLAFPVESRIQR